MEFNNEKFDLVEDFIDVGYMAENIEITDFNDETKEIKRSNQDQSMTLFISFPDFSENFIDEVKEVDEFIHDIQVATNCYFILDSKESLNGQPHQFKKFTTVFDTEEEFGNMYGTKITSGTLTDKLTKALFLISKDGAIFYLDMPENVNNKLNLERLQAELNKAYVSYTGVGCHG